MTREEKVRENAELILVGEGPVPYDHEIAAIINEHCPGDSIFEEIFSEDELGECLFSCAAQDGLSQEEYCRKHWKGEI